MAEPAYNDEVIPTGSRILAGLVLAASPLAAEAAPEAPVADGPTLYNRLAHAPHVVLGRVEEVGRRASIAVLEQLRGEAGETLEVAFRGDNYLRVPGTPPATFEEGERTLLLLEEATDRKGRSISGRYRLVGGPAGKLSLPLEGREAFLEVARRFVGIQDLPGQTARWDAMRALLDERDLRLNHLGLVKVVSFRLVDEELEPTLIRYLQHPSPPLRYHAVRALELLIVPPGEGRPSPNAARILSHLVASARGDRDEDVRAASLRVLGRLRRDDLEDLFREAATEDPSQLVRYEASVALADLGHELPPRR